MDRARIEVALVRHHEHHIVADVHDLLRRAIGLIVAQARKTELVAVVGHKAGQVVQLAEGVLDQAPARGLT